MDNKIIALTRREEEINLNNRSLNCYKNSSIKTFEVPIRAPISDEDVGDVILVSFGFKPGQAGYYIAICEGILLSACTSSSGDEDNPSPISGKLRFFFLSLLL